MTTPSRRPARFSRLLLWSLAINFVLLAAVAYFIDLMRAGRHDRPDTASTPHGSSPTTAVSVEALGRIQPVGGLISVFGPPGEQVTRIPVRVGERVEVGTPLGQFSGEQERRQSLDAFDRQVEEARALRSAIESSRDAMLSEIDEEAKQAEAGLAEDRAALAAKVRGMQARRKNAVEERQRLELARRDGVQVSEQELSQFAFVVELADAEMVGAEAQAKKIDAQQSQAKELVKAKKASVAAEANRAVAQVPLASLIAARESAASKLDSGTFRSPTAGTVIRILAKPGETIGNTPLVQIADLTRLGVVAEVYETDVGRLREWLARGPVIAEVETRTLSSTQSKPLRGIVSGPDQVASVIAKNVLTPLGPREDADRRIVDVDVALDPAPGIGNYIGVQVRCRFLAPR